MSGFHHNDSLKGHGSNKPKGIQFVKPSEPLLHQSADSDASSSWTSSIGLSHNGLIRNGPLTFDSPAVGSTNHRAPVPDRYSQPFVKAGQSYSSIRSTPDSSNNYGMPRFTNLNNGGSSRKPAPFPKTAEAKPMGSVQNYRAAWKEEKDPVLVKFRKLAFEVVALKTERPNAIDKLHSAANRVPVHVEFKIQSVKGGRNSESFLCYVYVDNITIASGEGMKIKDSKTNAYEAALQKILMPYLRVIDIDPISRWLQSSKEPFTLPPPEPSKVPLHSPKANAQLDISSANRETNLKQDNLKRRHNEFKELEEFVLMEPVVPIPDCTPAHTLRRSADFNHMILEYEYFFKGESVRCVLKLENEVIADVTGNSKPAAKNNASLQALVKLKSICWVIKIKKAFDSSSTISKDDLLSELNEQTDSIQSDNIGNKMLRKMGWSGGGVGKEEDGIAEPIELKSVLNREGLGLSASKGITDEFCRKIREVIEHYAASPNQDDLVFSFDFRLDERQIIHDECRRLNLKSKCKGKKMKKYICVRRKRSVNQLFQHLMSVGGETMRYKLVPPGGDLPMDNATLKQGRQMSSNNSNSQTSCMLSNTSNHPVSTRRGISDQLHRAPFNPDNLGRPNNRVHQSSQPSNGPFQRQKSPRFDVNSSNGHFKRVPSFSECDFSGSHVPNYTPRFPNSNNNMSGRSFNTPSDDLGGGYNNSAQLCPIDNLSGAYNGARGNEFSYPRSGFGFEKAGGGSFNRAHGSNDDLGGGYNTPQFPNEALGSGRYENTTHAGRENKFASGYTFSQFMKDRMAGCGVYNSNSQSMVSQNSFGRPSFNATSFPNGNPGAGYNGVLHGSNSMGDGFSRRRNNWM